MILSSAACKHRVSGSLSLPSRGPFHLSFTVLFSIGHQVVFRLGGWSLPLPAGFHVSRSTLDSASCLGLSCTGLSPSLAGFPNTILLGFNMHVAVLNPERPKSLGLASCHFARRYFGNRVFFLFLSLLRCFSSRRSLYNTMDSCYSD